MHKQYHHVITALLSILCFASAQATPSQNIAERQAQLANALTRQIYANLPAKDPIRNLRAFAGKYRPVLLERFLKYVSYNRQSSETESITADQVETAKKLYAEIKALGYDVTLTPHHYIFVEIPSNINREVPVLGYSAHYDVTPGIEANNIKARVIQKYDGSPIVLENNQVIDPAQSNGTYLAEQVGKTVVTSDGNTLLGADDGAGLSVLITFLQTLAENPKRPHGKIQIVIAPNEDVGRAAEFVEETPYRPEIAFDFDGGSNGRVIIENFNARQELFTVHGVPGHQSYAATNGYRNAWTPACELGVSICQKHEMPNYSTGRQGYAELHHMSAPDGKVSKAELDVRLRGFDTQEMDMWENNAEQLANLIAKKYDVTITHKKIDSYKNVGECAHPNALEITKKAFENAGVKSNIQTARAGTTAAMFVTKGLVGAYTIFTGQNNPHNYTEWLSEEDMYHSFLLSLSIMDEVAKQPATRK